MHEPESVLENETHKFSGVLIYKPITKSRPDDQNLEIVYKKYLSNSRLHRSGGGQSEKERK